MVFANPSKAESDRAARVDHATMACLAPPVSVDRAIGQTQLSMLAFVPKLCNPLNKKAAGIAGIGDFTGALREIPGDWMEFFNKDW